MPTYSYLCAACGHDFDQYQSFTDNALVDCPTCSEPQLRKVFSNIGVTFKGSGFYRTDSRSGSEAKSSTDAAAPKKSTESSPKTPAPAAASSTTSSSTTSTS